MKNANTIRIIGRADGPTSVFVAGHATRRRLQSWASASFVQRLSLGMIILAALRFTLYVARKVK